LGDSLTAGYGLELDEAYPALLQQKIADLKLPYLVVNAGLSGDTTAGGLHRLNWLMQKPPAILILALGANDGLRGLPLSQMEKNLEEILRQVRHKNPQVQIIVAGMQLPPNYGAAFTTEFTEVFRRVATRPQAYYLPFLLEGVAGKPELNQADQIHPTAAGQKIIAENMWKVLQPLLRPTNF
jgi:acyl-CoA thioesterase-1